MSIARISGELQLVPSSDFHINWGGLNEKWIQGEDSTWYYITPSGDFYKWSGDSMQGNFKIATVSSDYYSDPNRLANAYHNYSVLNANADLLMTTALGLDEQLDLQSGSDYFNWGGMNERWSRGADGEWYFVLPSGDAYHWHGGDLIDSTWMGRIGSDYHHNIAALTGAVELQNAASLVDDAIIELDEHYGLETSSEYHLNWGGENEKWIRGDDGWFFLTEDGELREWHGGGLDNSSWIANLDEAFYDLPSLLTDAHA